MMNSALGNCINKIKGVGILLGTESQNRLFMCNNDMLNPRIKLMEGRFVRCTRASYKFGKRYTLTHDLVHIEPFRVH